MGYKKESLNASWKAVIFQEMFSLIRVKSGASMSPKPSVHSSLICFVHCESPLNWA